MLTTTTTEQYRQATLDAFDLDGRPLIVNYGAGTDSTAVLVGLHQLGIVPDAVMFGDTGGELPEVYEQLDNMDEWLASVGFPQITRCTYQATKSSYSDLEGNMLANETLPSPAFGGRGGVGKGSCSLKWKVKPMDQYLRHWQPAVEAWGRDRLPLKLLGFDCTEAHRTEKHVDTERRRVEKTDADGNVLVGKRGKPLTKMAGGCSCGCGLRFGYAYPLRIWGWDRQRCQDVCRAAGAPLPATPDHKSACFYCPARKKCELLDLVDTHPELARRGVAMEDRARHGRHGLKTSKGLGRNWSWREYLEAERPGFLDGAEETAQQEGETMATSSFSKWTERTAPRFGADTPTVAFASGVSTPGNARPFVSAGHPIGVVADKVSESFRSVLRSYAGMGGLVFVDSGAFSAFTKGATVDFGAVLELYADLARGCAQPANLHVVAPDVVGDQAATLQLLAEWRTQLRELQDLGATILVGFQQGELRDAELYGAVDDALDGMVDFVPAFAFKAAAWAAEDVAAFCAATWSERVHLLGGGPRAIREVQALCPRTLVQGDSVRLRGWVGARNKAGRVQDSYAPGLAAVYEALGGLDPKAARKAARRRMKELAVEALAQDCADGQVQELIHGARPSPPEQKGTRVSYSCQECVTSGQSGTQVPPPRTGRPSHEHRRSTRDPRIRKAVRAVHPGPGPRPHERPGNPWAGRTADLRAGKGVGAFS